MRKQKNFLSTLTRGQTWFLSALAVAVITPFLAITGLSLHNAMLIARLGGAFEARADSWKAEAEALDRQINPQSLKDPIKRNAYRLLLEHDEVAPERRVIVTLQVPLGLKKTGGDRPRGEDELAEEASAATQAMAEAECGLILGSLAADCAPMAATGRRVGVGVFEYQLQLAFREATSFGKRDAGKRYDFVLTRSSPGAEYTRQRFYFEKSAGQRRKIYQSAAAACAEIRRQAGNCSITALSVASRLDVGTPMIRLSASAAYASLVKTQALASAN